MKINRLLEMTIILLSKGTTVTAKNLADKFGVSIRTIYRDIDDLSLAGVPVYANRGAGGGIALLDNYQLPRTIITDEESESILFALEMLKKMRYPNIDSILDKLSALFTNSVTDWIHIDFNSWGGYPEVDKKIEKIKSSVLQCKIIEFDYVSAENEKTFRAIKPLKLMYQWNSWYIWGWCLQREDYRMFRLSRIQNLTVTNKSFQINIEQKINKARKNNPTPVMNPLIKLELKFSKNVLYRVYDFYDEKCITRNPDGTYTVRVEYPEDEWVYSHILSFGEHVKVVSPERVKNVVRDKIQNLMLMYGS